jgi:hypothetical protein
MSTISSGTTTTTGYVVTSDTSGELVIKTGSGAGTIAMTIDASQNIAFAKNPAFNGQNVSFNGYIELDGSTSGYVRLQAAAVAGSATYTLPSADGTSGQFLRTNGSGTLTWGSSASGAQDYIVQSYGIV